MLAVTLIRSPPSLHPQVPAEEPNLTTNRGKNTEQGLQRWAAVTAAAVSCGCLDTGALTCFDPETALCDRGTGANQANSITV